MKGRIDTDFVIGITMVAFVIWPIASWLTHVIVCVQTASWGSEE